MSNIPNWPKTRCTRVTKSSFELVCSMCAAKLGLQRNPLLPPHVVARKAEESGWTVDASRFKTVLGHLRALWPEQFETKKGT